MSFSLRLCFSLRMSLRGRPRVWSEFTLHSEPVTIKVEGYWNRNKAGGNTAKQSRGPLDTHVLEHLAREEGEACSDKRPAEGVCSNGRCGTVDSIRLEMVSRRKQLTT